MRVCAVLWAVGKDLFPYLKVPSTQTTHEVDKILAQQKQETFAQSQR